MDGDDLPIISMAIPMITSLDGAPSSAILVSHILSGYSIVAEIID